MISAKIEPLDRDVAAIIDELLSPAAQSRALAEVGRQAIDEAAAINRSAFGHALGVTVFVDGREGAALESVRPDGTIVAEFALLADILVWIDGMLRQHSPVRSGRYLKSHTLLADGSVCDPKNPPRNAREFVFVPFVPYARKIEPDPRTGRKGESKQAPDGVYMVVAVLGKQMFGRVVPISFDRRSVVGMDESVAERRARPGAPRDMRQPAIVIKAG